MITGSTVTIAATGSGAELATDVGLTAIDHETTTGQVSTETIRKYIENQRGK